MPRQLIAAALVMIAGATGAVAQVNTAAPDDSKQANQGVYVRDSAVAAEKMALGERMERLKDWDKAADVFQEILEKYADRVVQSTVPGQANHYSSVIVAVQERLAKWPEDGLRAYRNRYEAPAADLLAAAGRDDYGALNTVYQRYFITNAGKTAGLRLIDLYLENGEFSAAAWLGDRLLQWHPTITPDKPAVLYRVAVAYHLSGDQEKANARLEELKNFAPNSTGTVRGQDVNLADSLAKDLAAPIAVAQNESADSWPVFMGDATRGRISTGAGRAGARPFSSIDLAHPSNTGLTPEARQEAESAEKLDQEQGLNLGIIPAVDRGEMFFQDGSRIYAVSLDSGAQLPGWTQPYVGSNVITPGSHRQQYTVTVTDKEVLAVIGQADRTISFPGQPPTMTGDARLVCLDRATGKEKWSRSPRDFPDQGNVRALSLGGSPLVVGDNVYICGTGGKSQQFDDCYVFCLDRATGNHKWSAYICSASTGQTIMGGDVAPASDTACSVAYSSGRLYVLSNLGAVAAVDAYSGAISWLDTYERDTVDNPTMMRFGMGATPQLTRPWACNPAVVYNGRIFALPSDGKYLSVYDAGSGETLKRVSLGDVDNANTLIGVQGNKIIVSSDTRVFAFNWEAYDPATFDPHSKVIYWTSTFSKTPIRGRGFLTADSVFIPTRDRLFRLSLPNNGKVTESYPPYSRPAWEDAEGPGNVIVTDDKVIIAGSAHINVYTDLGAALKRLDSEIVAAPSDPNVRLRYADMVFVAGDIKASVTRLDEAIKLLGGAGSLAPGPARDRIFRSALTFAQKLSDPKTYSADNRDTINGLFDRAASAADSASQQVEYRVARAHFAHANNDLPEEVRLYQEILADDAMRAVPLTTSDGNSFQQAAATAESAIDSIIKQSGASAYAPYEQSASAAMEAARTANKPDDLLQVAQHFPNASVASQSMFLAAEAYESAGDNRRATQVLRQLYFKYPRANKVAVLESMARNYLAIPGRSDVAAARLAQAAHLAGSATLSKPLKLPDGRVLENVTFTQAADALKQIQSDAIARSLPQFNLPAAAIPHSKPLVQTDPIPNIAALILPLPSYARLDRAITFSADSQIGCYAPGSPQPLWLNKSLTSAPLECAWIGTNQLAVWNSAEIAVLSGENGTLLWRFAIKSLPEIQVVKGDESVAATAAAPDPNAAGQVGGGFVIIQGQRIRVAQGGRLVINNNGLLIQRGFGGMVVNPANPQVAGGVEKIAQVRPAGDKLIAATTTGRIFALDIAAGHLAWQSRLTTDHPIERLLATDDFAVARFSDGAATSIIALDAATGQIIRRYDQFRADNGTIPVNQALSPDGTLVIALPDHLIGKDLYEPGAANKWETVRQNNADSVYVGSELPDQLLAQDGRIILVSDAGSFIRVFSLDTGMPITAKGDTGPMNVRFPTGARSGTPVHLRLAGAHLYAFGPQSLRAFDLDHPNAIGERVIFEDTNLRDLFVGSDFAVALDDPGVARFIGNPDAPSIKARLLAYSRATVNGQESGVLVHDPVFPEPKGITTWQPLTGGFFYLTGDQQLHFLKPNGG
ncbi:MAG TPA: PQQ-binding-like beta-propeller repeat protein [Tepidisphaeraceae bacterium]|jgi:outer membrane protein assembly factor BamB/TolA-binding protein|nr:PQQ-binding-like beta-propeller repeat protein [Tepidisphaeraceae bacterium]